MTPEVRRVGAFRIEGDLNNLQLVLLSDAEDEMMRYRLTPEMVCKLAIEIPRYAKLLANGGAIDDDARSKLFAQGK